jgi:hypothetical protein
MHNTWTHDWTIGVTILGWLLLIRGIVRLWFPQASADIAKKILNKVPMMSLGLVTLFIGAYFLYFGFMA